MKMKKFKDKKLIFFFSKKEKKKKNMIKNSPNFGLISTPFCVLISLPFSLWLSRFKLFICIIPPLEHYFTHSHQVGLHFSTTITNSPYSVPQDLSPRSPLILSFLLFALVRWKLSSLIPLIYAAIDNETLFLLRIPVVLGLGAQIPYMDGPHLAHGSLSNFI